MCSGLIGVWLTIGRAERDMEPIRSQEDVRKILAERGWNVSRTRIYQLEQRALKKLRSHLRSVAVEFGYCVEEEVGDVIEVEIVRERDGDNNKT